MGFGSMGRNALRAVELVFNVNHGEHKGEEFFSITEKHSNFWRFYPTLGAKCGGDVVVSGRLWYFEIILDGVVSCRRLIKLDVNRVHAPTCNLHEIKLSTKSALVISFRKYKTIFPLSLAARFIRLENEEGRSVFVFIDYINLPPSWWATREINDWSIAWLIAAD